ncbi:MAG: rod shape-determining protein, partial [Patescibacteria group bacterium]|nr:rod shape-determining protein [Patescibacteria group bacterium]
HSLLIGEKTAEEVKIAIGSAFPTDQLDRHTVVRGRSVESGLPTSLRLSENEVREAIAPVIHEIVDALADTIEETPPELMGDIIEHGIVLAGGGSLIRGIDQLIATELKMPVWVADDPLTAVVRGTGKLLDDRTLLRKIKIGGKR